MSTLDVLPLEALHVIFSKLSGAEVMVCRTLSDHCKIAVDTLPDTAWKYFYCKAHKNAQQDKCLSQLSWQQLYCSVLLWNNIKEAKPCITYEFSYDNIVDFKVLKNGTLALLQTSCGKQKYLDKFLSDTVIYCDLKTFKEIGTNRYDVYFQNYNENDKFIVFIQENNLLRITHKVDPSNYYVTKLDGFGQYSVYHLCNSKVFYFDEHEIFCIAQLKEKKGKTSIKIKETEVMCETPLAFSHQCKGEDCKSMKINVLTTKGEIFKYTSGDFEYADELNEYTWFHLYMADYDFDWTRPKVLEWLYGHFDNEKLGITKYDFSSIYEYKNVLLFGTPDAKIHIYVDPYIPDAGLRSFEQKGDYIIDTSTLSQKTGKIVETFIIECENGHQIITLASTRVIILKLIHSVTN